MAVEMNDLTAPGSDKPVMLYNPRYFQWIAVFTTLLIPAILYSMNLMKLGRKDEARKSLALWGLGWLGFVAAIVFLPDQIAGVSKYLVHGINVVAGMSLARQQEADYKEWLSKGGRPRSPLLPILAALVPLAGLVYILVADPFSGKALYIEEEDSIRYSTSIPAADVKAIYGLLRDAGFFFVDKKTVTAELMDDSTGYLLEIAFKKGIVDAATVANIEKEMDSMLGTLPLAKKARFRAVDSSGKPLY